MFKVGDRVSTPEYGLGTIVLIDTNYLTYGVRYDNFNTKLHDLDGKCENGYGLWYYENQLSLVEEKEEVALKFKVGDRVKNKADGEGIVTDIDMDLRYPVIVEFTKVTRTFTLKGLHLYRGRAIDIDITLVEDITRTYTRSEIIAEFYKNPDIKVIQIKSSVSSCMAHPVDFTLLPAFVRDDKAEFIIEERKLRKMSYGEVIYNINHHAPRIGYDTIISTVTGKDYTRDNDEISLEEFVGTWTIEGFYGDE